VSARALWAVGPGRCELRDEPVEAPGAGQVQVRATVGAVSRGTERLVVHGRVPVSERERMRGPHMGGRFEFPVKYGYVSVGVVEAGDAPAGQPVFCLHPHQSRYTVPAGDVVPLPPETPAGRAVFAPNLETAVNVVWDSGASVGDRVAVVGGGVVGCLVAWLAGRLPGSDVALVDPVDRSDVARALGVRWQPGPEGLGDRDVVVHASGNPAGAAAALALAGDEATVVEASWFGAQEVSLPLGGAFHSRRLTLKSSQVGRLPPARRPRWAHRRRLELALRLAADPVLDVLVSDDIPFEALPQRLPAITAPGDTGLCYRVRYPGA